MVKYFCDFCDNEMHRNDLLERTFIGVKNHESGTVSHHKVQVIAQGHICTRCVRRIVNEGPVQ